MPNWKKLVVSGSNANLNSLNLSSVVNAGEDTDKFLVLDSSGNIDFRTGANVLSDIGAASSAGAVDTTGTPADNQIAVFTDSNTLEGDANFTWDGSKIFLSNGKHIQFTDQEGTFPTNKDSKFKWLLNNDSYEHFAFQPASDQIDVNFKITDNAQSTDRFVFWIDDYRGETYDAYPLYMDGNNFVVNYKQKYNSGTAYSNNVDFYIAASGSTAHTTNPVFKADVSAGNIGIGTNTPGEKLTVAGNISSSGTVTANSLVGTLGTAAQPNITSLGTINSLVTTDDLTIAINSSIIESDSDRTLLSPMATGFSIGSGLNYPLTINSNITASANISASGDITAANFDTVGKVTADISITTPVIKSDTSILKVLDNLDVVGHITASGNISGSQFFGTHFSSGNNTDNGLDLATNNTMQFRVGGASRITHTSTIFRPSTDEAVSLGRPAQKWKELVVNHITASGDISSSGEVFGNSLKTDQYLNFGSDVSLFRDGVNILRTDDVFHANGDIHIFDRLVNRSQTSNYIEFATNKQNFNVPQATFTGDITASANISASGDVHLTNLQFGDFTGDIHFGTDSTSNKLSYNEWKQSASGGTTINNTAGTINFDSKGNADTMVISGSNVGIGTTSPTHKLHIVDGSDSFKYGADIVSGFDGIKLTGGAPGIEFVGPGDDFLIGKITAGVAFFNSTDSSYKMILNDDGNLGIGTNFTSTTPPEKLTVEGNISASGDLYLDGDNIYLGNEETRLRTYSSYLGIFAAGGSAKDVKAKSLTLSNDFGDSAPTNGLYVKGEATFKDNVTIEGTLTAEQYVTTTVSSSVIYQSGSTQFGDTIDDTHTFTGSLNLSGSAYLSDNTRLNFGSDNDLHIRHNGTNAFITNGVGDLTISNNADDKDVIFQSDDGTGGTTTYFLLDGSLKKTRFWQSTRHIDNVYATFGTSDDLQIYHDASNSYIDQNGTGDLLIKTSNGTSDIIFNSGSSEYFRLDASARAITVSAAIGMYFNDGVAARFGTSGDLIVFHDASDSFISNGTGDLYIRNTTDNKDIIFESDDGSGGITEYLRLDGGTEQNIFSKDILVTNALLSNQENTDVDTGTETVATVAHASYDAAFFDFVIKSGTNLRAGTVFATHDGTNVQFTETSTNDLGDTSDVTLSVDISGADLRLRATTTSDNWTVKSLVRGL